MANACAHLHFNYGRDSRWMERAIAACNQAVALRPELAEVLAARAWVQYASGDHDEAVRLARLAIDRKRDCEGAYYLLARALFAAGRYREVADIAEVAVNASGEDYNVYVPIMNSLMALGKTDAARNLGHHLVVVLEEHVRKVPEDARARIHLAGEYATQDRVDDALRECQMAVTLRPNEATVQYNAACLFCRLNRKPEALAAIRKAWENGFRESAWARRDPDLALLRDDPEFDRLFPASEVAS
jgi:tetratricopeptide (TPR) repeat protein